MGTLDTLPEEPDVLPQVCRLEKIDGNTGPAIKDEINAVLDQGWRLNSILNKGNSVFAVFVRPKRQQ